MLHSLSGRFALFDFNDVGFFEVSFGGGARSAGKCISGLECHKTRAKCLTCYLCSFKANKHISSLWGYHKKTQKHDLSSLLWQHVYKSRDWSSVRKEREPRRKQHPDSWSFWREKSARGRHNFIIFSRVQTDENTQFHISHKSRKWKQMLLLTSLFAMESCALIHC